MHLSHLLRIVLVLFGLLALSACDSESGAGGGGAGGATATTNSTSHAASSSTGRPVESEVHFQVACDGGTVQVDCVGDQITQRRADDGAIAFDCDATNGYAKALLFAPGPGDASTWPYAPRRIFAGCTGATRSSIVNPGAPGHSIVVGRFEPGSYAEGTFANADGTLQGTFAIHDANGM